MNLSQFVISSKIKHAPNVFDFTEQGVAMLSGVLKSERAIYVNISIMRAFVRLRKMITSHKELAAKLTQLEGKLTQHDKEIWLIFEAIKQLIVPPEKKGSKIGFKREECS